MCKEMAPESKIKTMQNLLIERDSKTVYNIILFDSSHFKDNGFFFSLFFCSFLYCAKTHNIKFSLNHFYIGRSVALSAFIL